MKPQLIVTDLAGHHNGNLPEASSRIIRGASWKKQRTVVIIPTADRIPAKCALAMWNLVFPPNNAVVKILALGQEVGEAYTNAIQSVLDHPELSTWEFILTIEEDNSPPNDGVVKLIETMEAHPELSCVGGLYFTKGEGGVPQIWGDPKDPVLNFRPQPPVADQLIECCGTGMGFNLFRIKMFKDPKLRKPWFKTVADATGVGTQDLYAWSDFRKHGYRCAIDCRVRVGHYDVGQDLCW